MAKSVIWRKVIRPAFVNPKVLLKAMFLVIAYSAFVVVFTNENPDHHLGEATQALQLSTIAIGLIFTFRINTAYDRWYEGRRLWGQLVNDVRNLGVKTPLYLEIDNDTRVRFARLITGFAFALKHHLRDDRFDMTHVHLEPAPADVKHIPLWVTQQVYGILSSLQPRANASHISQLLIDGHAKVLMDVCGACERIRATPISGWFTASIWMWLSSYLMLLPWLIAPRLDFWTIPVMVFAGYFGMALELLAEEMQDPFGTDPGDLPLDKICHNIANSMEQVFGISLDPGAVEDVEEFS